MLGAVVNVFSQEPFGDDDFRVDSSRCLILVTPEDTCTLFTRFCLNQSPPSATSNQVKQN
jgi:hypothetical protein